MKRIIMMLALTALLVVALSMSALSAFALEEGNGRGNPTTTKNGKCPPGVNKDLSPGGQKKCD